MNPITKEAVEILTGPPTETGERWQKWEISNAIATFVIQWHTSGEVHVLLKSSRPLLFAKCMNAEQFEHLMEGLGFAACDRGWDCNAGSHGDTCDNSEAAVRARIHQNRKPKMTWEAAITEAEAINKHVGYCTVQLTPGCEAKAVNAYRTLGRFAGTPDGLRSAVNAVREYASTSGN